MSNAQESLQKARKEDNYYHNSKYVRTACGTAYNGVLLALDALLASRGVDMHRKKRRSIEFYTYNVARMDGKLLKELNTAYNILHLAGYYDGEQNAGIIREGFKVAYSIIERIRPNNPLTDEEWAERRRRKSPLLKRMVMALLV